MARDTVQGVAWTDGGTPLRARRVADARVQVERWDDTSSAWRELPSAEASARQPWYPRLTLGPDDAPVLVWRASSRRGVEPYTATWEQRRYDAGSGAWQDVGPHFPGFVTAVGHTARGELVACEQRVCFTVQQGAWAPLGVPATGGTAVPNVLARDASGVLHLLGREGPQYGGTWEPEGAKPSLRLHRYVP